MKTLLGAALCFSFLISACTDDRDDPQEKTQKKEGLVQVEGTSSGGLKIMPLESGHLRYDMTGYGEGGHEIWWVDYGQTLYSKRKYKGFIECRTVKDSVLSLWDESNVTDSLVAKRYISNAGDVHSMIGIFPVGYNRDSLARLRAGFSFLGNEGVLDLKGGLWRLDDAEKSKKFDGKVEMVLWEGLEIRSKNYAAESYGYEKILTDYNLSIAAIPDTLLIEPNGYGVFYRGDLYNEMHPKEAQ